MRSTLIAAAVLSTLVLSGQAKATDNSSPFAPIQITQLGNAALAKEKQAEADFKTARPAQAQVSKQVQSLQAKSAVVAAPNERMSLIAVMHPIDGAALLAARCSSLKRHKLKCMNLELSLAEAELGSTEVKLLNCTQLRKFDGEVPAATLDGFVVGRMNQLRFRATQSLNSEMEAAGALSRMKTHEIELRATLAHLNAVASLASRVCSAPKFKAFYAESMAEGASK